jgi:hypothetical protein
MGTFWLLSFRFPLACKHVRLGDLCASIMDGDEVAVHARTGEVLLARLTQSNRPASPYER